YAVPSWGPNFQESLYSLFNLAIRIIALDTFKQALTASAYSFLGTTGTHANNMDVLLKIYDHIVHYCFCLLYMKDGHNPGSVEAAGKANPQYQASGRLTKDRIKFLKHNAYPQQYQDLIDSKATSDDELDPKGSRVNGRAVCFIAKQPERSAKAEAFICKLDKLCELAAQLQSQQHTDLCVVPPANEQNISHYLAIPFGMPLDYFDPQFYNTIPHHMHAWAAVRSVTILPDPALSFTDHPDERLSDSAFNKKYLPGVLDSGYWFIDLDELDAAITAQDEDDTEENTE
ncbi:hypothetical protein FA15DRAFT_561144, partial [Coprinopsis marcescibilis]